MCGIAGLFDTQGQRTVDDRLLARMNDSLRHRGPDGDGLLSGPGCGLAHRRLAIIDLAGGRQPLCNEDGSVVVVFNGEIYNFRALRGALEAAGHRFATDSDTEVIVHGWEEWGEACVTHFRGMFAFALWDRSRDVLFLARDRLGIKPLYYAVPADGWLLFGSELKALSLHPGLRRTLDPTAVEDYFALGYVPDPKTIYRDVRKLAPGHTLLVRRDAGEAVPRRYWSLASPDCNPNGGDPAADLIERLREAVRLRLIADVPLGAFLSGGVDSSAVVAMMAKLSEAPVNTCSIAFADERFDESAYATIVAERYRTRHRTHVVDDDGLDIVDLLPRLYDEPFADSSAIPTYRVCALARTQVTVALSGDGGDEVFWGYRRYRWHADEMRLRGWLPGRGGRWLASLASAGCPELRFAPVTTGIKKTLSSLGVPALDAYARSIAVVDEATRQRLYAPGFRRDLQGYRAIDALRPHYEAAPSDHPVGRVSCVDLMTYLPGDILTKVDRASMVHGLEVRVPMLDHPLVEWSLGLSAEAKFSNGEPKGLLKRAIAPFLPHALIHRPKMGFAVPIDAWFRGPLRERIERAVDGPGLGGSGLFDRSALLRLVDEHTSRAEDHGSALWALLMFDGFWRSAHAL